MIAENRLERGIIELFARDIFLRLSIRQIAQRLRKHYPAVHKKVTSMISEGVFNASRVGHSSLCWINLKSEKAGLLLAEYEIMRRERSQFSMSEELLRKLRENACLLFAVLHRKKLILCAEHPEKARAEVRKAHLRKRTAVMSPGEMAEAMLRRDMLKNRIILYGATRFYEFLADNEGMLREKYDSLRGTTG